MMSWDVSSALLSHMMHVCWPIQNSNVQKLNNKATYHYGFQRRQKIWNALLSFAFSTSLNGIYSFYNTLHKCTLNWTAWLKSNKQLIIKTKYWMLSKCQMISIFVSIASGLSYISFINNMNNANFSISTHFCKIKQNMIKYSNNFISTIIWVQDTLLKPKCWQTAPSSHVLKYPFIS